MATARWRGETVRRKACEARVHAVIRNLDGEPLAVSRSRRFGTRAQRRALMVRDKHCQFPGCARERHLKIHHVASWLDGGGTDLGNLTLLCQFHHTAVHEGGITIAPGSGSVRWHFIRPDTSTIIPEVTGCRVESALDAFGQILSGRARDIALATRERLTAEHAATLAEVAARQVTIGEDYQAIENPTDPAALRIAPVGGGEGFNLRNCVEVLFLAHQLVTAPAKSTELAQAS